MPYFRIVPAMLLIGGMSLGMPADDSGKPPTPASLRHLPPVLRNPDPADTSIIRLPGNPTPPPVPAPPVPETVVPPHPTLPADDPDRPILRRAVPSYPPEFGVESGLFCQDQIGEWTEEDAIALLGEPKRHRPSLSNDGEENGDIFAFADPSMRYRELELDFDSETGTLRTVFAYPWKLSWLECRKLWGLHFSAADAEKGRVFYSYLDRRLDVLVDAAGKVISLGLY